MTGGRKVGLCLLCRGLSCSSRGVDSSGGLIDVVNVFFNLVWEGARGGGSTMRSGIQQIKHNK